MEAVPPPPRETALLEKVLSVIKRAFIVVFVIAVITFFSFDQFSNESNEKAATMSSNANSLQLFFDAHSVLASTKYKSKVIDFVKTTGPVVAFRGTLTEEDKYSFQNIDESIGSFIAATQRVDIAWRQFSGLRLEKLAEAQAHLNVLQKSIIAPATNASKVYTRHLLHLVQKDYLEHSLPLLESGDHLLCELAPKATSTCSSGLSGPSMHELYRDLRKITISSNSTKARGNKKLWLAYQTDLRFAVETVRETTKQWENLQLQVSNSLKSYSGAVAFDPSKVSSLNQTAEKVNSELQNAITRQNETYINLQSQYINNLYNLGYNLSSQL